MLKKIKSCRTSNAVIATVLILMLSFTALATIIPYVTAQTGVTLTPYFYPVIGVNSPTLINWRPSPNLLFDPPYASQTDVWPNATATFTRPDGTTDVVNGPFKTTFPIPGRNVKDIILVYTPNMEGTWTVNFTWPGDSKYEAVSRVDNFTVGAHFEKRQSFAMLSLRPYPAVGLNQQILINAWVTPPPLSDRDFYEQFDFTIKKPDGTIYYQFSLPSEGPGTAWFDITLNELGNWTITFSFPGDHLTKPSSVTRSIIVQQDPIPYPIADTPLPTEAWTYPINVYNREWRNIAGPWYQSYYNASQGSWNPYTTAPKSAHILWKADPVSGLGGYIGATSEEPGITTDAMYDASPVNIRTVMAGRGYYTGNGMIHCVNITNGEKLWMVNGSFNVGATRSGQPVLYQFSSTRFRVYNALTGEVTLDVPGASMTMFDDPYVYTYTGATASTSAAMSPGPKYIAKWTTAGSSTNFTSRIIWNVSYPFPLYQFTGTHSVIIDDLLVCRQFQGGTILVEAFGAINATTGETVYYTEIMNKSNTDTWIYRQGPAIGSAYGRVFFAMTGTPQLFDVPNSVGGYIAINASTGEIDWMTGELEYPWGNFWAYMPQASAYDRSYGLSYAGVYAFNVTTGEVLWHYTAGNSGMETPYNTWAFGSTGPVIGGGIVFAPNTEHSPTLYYRGERLHAIDAFNGTKVWSIMGNYVPTAIAYGILLAQENPSGITYAFGKGQTAISVSASPKTVATGSTVLIEGTVMDMSPAQPNTPCVSDDSMTAWMEYLHMQQPLPTNVTGVKVHLTAISSDGSSHAIGIVTTDMSGLYAATWDPPAKGAYTIYATFEGSESYYSSYASTAIGVGTVAAGSSPSVTSPPTSPSVTSPAPTTTASASPTDSVAPTSSPSAIPGPESDGGTGIYIAIAAVVIIAAVIAVALVLRRRSK